MAQEPHPLESTIVDAVRDVLRDGLPTVQKALVLAESDDPAQIAIAIKWVPDEGIYQVKVTGRVTTPTTGTIVKTKIVSGQLVLL